MRLFLFAIAVALLLNHLAVSILCLIPVWGPYLAEAAIDFPAVDALTGHYVHSVAYSPYQLRWIVLAMSIEAVISYFLIAAAVNHSRKKLEKDEDFYGKYHWYGWWIAATVLILPIFIGTVMVGMTNIFLQCTLCLSCILSILMVGPVHRMLNSGTSSTPGVAAGLKETEWTAFVIGVIIFVVYSTTSLTYVIRSEITSTVPWANWALFVGLWLLLTALVVLHGVSKLISARVFSIALLLIPAISATWVAWLFFAATVAY